MKFFKDPTHIRALLLHVVAGAAATATCFFVNPEWGLTMAIVCVMFTVFRLLADVAYDVRVRAVDRRAQSALRGDSKPTLPDEKSGALYELEGTVYKLTIRAVDSEALARRQQEEADLLLHQLAWQLTQRAEELPANVHRRELIALAQDMVRLAELPAQPVQEADICPTTVADIWQDVTVLSSETLRIKQICVAAEVGTRAYVTTCPREAVVGGLCGLVETCARHADVGATFTVIARETPVYTEFRLSCDRFDWSENDLLTLFDVRQGTEPALIYLARLAALYGGEIRAERTDGQVHLIFRLYQSTR